MIEITNLYIRCTSCESIDNPNRSKNYPHIKIAGPLASALVGFLMASVISLASAGFRIAVTLPLGGLGLFFGYLLGAFGARAHDG